jgi:hypothetical protein
MSQLTENTYSIEYSIHTQSRFSTTNDKLMTKQLKKKKVIKNSETDIYLNFTITLPTQRKEAQKRRYN